jgi:hypothetical protein
MRKLLILLLLLAVAVAFVVYFPVPAAARVRITETWAWGSSTSVEPLAIGLVGYYDITMENSPNRTAPACYVNAKYYAADAVNGGQELLKIPDAAVNTAAASYTDLLTPVAISNTMLSHQQIAADLFQMLLASTLNRLSTRATEAKMATIATTYGTVVDSTGLSVSSIMVTSGLNWMPSYRDTMMEVNEVPPFGCYKHLGTTSEKQARSVAVIVYRIVPLGTVLRL